MFFVSICIGLLLGADYRPTIIGRCFIGAPLIIIINCYML